MADAVETDATVQLRVEKMDLVEFTSHLANRQSFVATLSMGIPQYASKRHLLELAVNIERAASENVRTIAAITIQDGATGANMTEERKAAMLVKARQDLFEARKSLKFANLVAKESFAVAGHTVGQGGGDDLMSDLERKRLEEARRKSMSNTWGGGARRGNLLNMMVAGGKRFKRDKSNAPCFDCHQLGHWAGDQSCPLRDARDTAGQARVPGNAQAGGGDGGGQEED